MYSSRADSGEAGRLQGASHPGDPPGRAPPAPTPARRGRDGSGRCCRGSSRTGRGPRSSPARAPADRRAAPSPGGSPRRSARGWPRSASRSASCTRPARRRDANWRQAPSRSRSPGRRRSRAARRGGRRGSGSCRSARTRRRSAAGSWAIPSTASPTSGSPPRRTLPRSSRAASAAGRLHRARPHSSPGRRRGPGRPKLEAQATSSPQNSCQTPAIASSDAGALLAADRPGGAEQRVRDVVHRHPPGAVVELGRAGGRVEAGREPPHLPVAEQDPLATLVAGVTGQPVPAGDDPLQDQPAVRPRAPPTRASSPTNRSSRATACSRTAPKRSSNCDGAAGAAARGRDDRRVRGGAA